MNTEEIRKKFINYFLGKGHKIVPPSPIVPKDDATTLFTSSGMQQLVPYLRGKTHPLGKGLVNSQPCIRVDDIENVGDRGHFTFFEMLGNWSLGDYFKKEQLAYFWEFLTKELNIPTEKLFVTYFKGNSFVEKDEETYKIWRDLGVSEDHIYPYGDEKNWWSRCGTPEQMACDEIGGPDSEVFFDFGTPHDPKFGKECHPNCDCGRFLEIGNSVFMEYLKKEDGSLKNLPQKNVDFGGGLERLTMAQNNNPDFIFLEDFLKPIVEITERELGINFHQNPKQFKQIADHIRAIKELSLAGIYPSNKMQGYILRRLIRRTVFVIYLLTGEFSSNLLSKLLPDSKEVLLEETRFKTTLQKGVEKLKRLTDRKKVLEPKDIFNFYQSEGIPIDFSLEILKKLGCGFSEEQQKEVQKLFSEHKEQSKKDSAGVFKSGLADNSLQTTKLHTATHLLHTALKKILGPEIQQRGSNINSQRLRFDFNFDRKLTEKELVDLEKTVNEYIKENLPVECREMSLDEARKSGAVGLFGEKYGDVVTIYSIGKESKEFCAGPHIKTTGELGKFKILKEEGVGQGVRRIKAMVE